MKKVLLTTAMGMMLALPLAAQTVPAATGTETAPQVFFDRVGAGVKASDLVGKRVYAAKTLTGTEAALEKPADDWEDVGEVRDLVIDPAGDIEAALVDVGGFLGIGEKTVAVNMEALHLVPDAATAPVSAPTPTIPPAFDPEPAITTTATSSSASTTAAPKPTAKPRATVTPGSGYVPKGPKKPDDGSVELPTPGDDPGLPPPAP